MKLAWFMMPYDKEENENDGKSDESRWPTIPKNMAPTERMYQDQHTELYS